ncbi:MAG: DNA mismatch repair endonuclease MutL [Firmicutes bacterium]|nr:DNA mismatch repair endonuclease MutL [Bacillota bacterium]
MNKIHILDSSIFNRIAAGEVVESPSSVVKELVENAIDAGSTSILISIENGGVDKICVTDNGFGLSKEDLALAFLPHATSKIQSLDDLNAIMSLGFRGEALASIASVASVTMTSKQSNNEIGHFITYDNGELVASNETQSENGTTVIVKNLFEKIPARKKFLKKTSIETANITALVKNLILANPSIAFTYIADGKHIYMSDGTSLESAIYAVYGNLIESLVPLEASERGITLMGYTSLAENSKHNRTYQTLVVNNRVVENADIARSVYLAYKDYLFSRRYPAYILHIQIPYDLVDVNVHPNKMLVKFVDSVGVSKMVYHALKKVADMPTMPIFSDVNLDFSPLVEAESVATLVEAESVATKENIEYSAPKNSASNYGTTPFFAEPQAEHCRPTRKSVMNSFFELDDREDFIEIEIQNNHPNDFTIVGTFFNTYIAIQKGDDVFFIDQHASHERILFDKFIKAVKEKAVEIQSLLVPYEFLLEDIEAENLISRFNDLRELGFEINAKNNRFSLFSVPSILTNIKLNDFIELIINDDGIAKIDNSTFMLEKIAQKACKLAVKAGDSLSENEIQNLLHQMQNQSTPPLCPHGRPTIIKLTKTEIEKWFLRK